MLTFLFAAVRTTRVCNCLTEACINQPLGTVGGSAVHLDQTQRKFGEKNNYRKSARDKKYNYRKSARDSS
jgi:hypothetical protein